MNRLLLSLWLVGATYTGHTPILLQAKQEAPASAEQLVEGHATPLISIPASLQQMNVPEPKTSESQSVAVRSSAATRDDAQSITSPLRDGQMNKPPAPLPSAHESYEPNEEAIWVVVSRAARVHSGPSVSAPTVRFYRAGTELHLIGYKQGWFQVSDPATSQRGWIYERYYLEAIRDLDQTRATVQDSRSATRSAFEAPKQGQKRVKKQQQQVERVQFPIPSTRTPSESVASLVERAFLGY
ncbi:MAG: hypothetical protein WB662_01645 [Methyloceanibacter sp.]